MNQLMTEAVAAPPSSVSVSEPTPLGRYPIKILPASALSLETWELALEAWLDIRLQGYTIDEDKVFEQLPKIAARVPRPARSEALEQAITDVGQMFETPAPGCQPVFVALLRPQHGKVHFLYFWKAFGEAVHIAGASVNEGLVCELEILRDRLLRRVEEIALAGPLGASGGGSSSSFSSGKSSPVSACDVNLPTWALVEEVHRAASMSAFPNFWQRASMHLAGQLELEELSIEELTSVLLAWLHETQVWEASLKMQMQQQQGPQRITSTVSEEEVGMSVSVHIYDVSQEEGIQKLNRILAHKSSPLKFGGVFHAGVEVNGLEWSYGFSPCESRPGVCCVEPKTHPQHHFRQTVHLRNTKLPPEAIAEILSELVEDYPGHDYNLLRRNCCHFADEFCIRLGVGSIPGWVIRLARLGAGIETMLNNAPRPIKERILG